MKNWQEFINENMKIPGTLKRANDIKDRINLIRTDNFENWRENDEVLDLIDELESIDFYYDENSWEVKENIEINNDTESIFLDWKVIDLNKLITVIKERFQNEKLDDSIKFLSGVTLNYYLYQWDYIVTKEMDKFLIENFNIEFGTPIILTTKKI